MQTFPYELSMEENNGDTCDLDPNHTHFILVDSDNSNWGGETEYVIRY